MPWILHCESKSETRLVGILYREFDRPRLAIGRFAEKQKILMMHPAARPPAIKEVDFNDRVQSSEDAGEG